MDEKILSAPGRASAAGELPSLLGSGFGISRGEIEDGAGFLHEKARKNRVEKGWRERRKLLEGLQSVEAVTGTFDVIERVSRVSQYAWIPLGLNTYYMGLADGDFIEVVAEADNYFEVRAVEERELKFIGSGSSWKEAIVLADAWLVRNGVNDCFSRRDAGWREKEAKEAQVYLANKLTGLPKPFLSSLKRGQVSDLITSARALLLPAEVIKLGDKSRAGVSGNGGRGREVSRGVLGDGQAEDWHKWQFQRNV